MGRVGGWVGYYLDIEGSLEREEFPVLVSSHDHPTHQVLVGNSGGGRVCIYRVGGWVGG